MFLKNACAKVYRKDVNSENRKPATWSLGKRKGTASMASAKRPAAERAEPEGWGGEIFWSFYVALFQIYCCIYISRRSGPDKIESVAVCYLGINWQFVTTISVWLLDGYLFRFCSGTCKLILFGKYIGIHLRQGESLLR